MVLKAVLDALSASQGMLKRYRFTWTIPSCVRVSATGRVEPDVTGSSSPSLPSPASSTPQSVAQAAIGALRKRLDNRAGQDALALAGLGEVVAQPKTPSLQRIPAA